MYIEWQKNLLLALWKGLSGLQQQAQQPEPLALQIYRPTWETAGPTPDGSVSPQPSFEGLI